MVLLRGRVYESTSGMPIQGVVVSLSNQYSSVTGNGGEFVTDAPAGTYTLTISHREFAPYSVILNLGYDMDMGAIPLRQTRVRAL